MSKRMKLRISSRLVKKKSRKQSFGGKKHCRFTDREEQQALIDYKNVAFLRSFMTERNKILPARVSGNSLYYQREIARQIKLARSMALLPFCAVHM